jgi:hypothetical protein
MKKQLLKFGALLSLLILLVINSRAQSAKLTFENRSPVERTDELIVIRRSVLESKTGAIGKGKYVQLKNSKGQPVLVQYDDMDGDGNWDEMLLLLNFKPKERKQLIPVVADAPAAIKAVVRAHVRQKRKNPDQSFGPGLDRDSVPAGQRATDFSKDPLPPFLTEGPAWENDRVGFRIYMDVRNGKDIWGKISSAMVLEEVGADKSKSYHTLSDWGMDILKVGKSLGAGSLALYAGSFAGKDSLVRLGGTEMGPIIYEKISDGPIRACFRLHYPQWKIPGQSEPLQLTEEISIWGGQYFYESRVTIHNEPQGSRVVAGIVNLLSKVSKTMDAAQAKILYTYDRQSENKDSLGMAIMVPAKELHKFITTPNKDTDIQNTYAVSMNISDNQARYRFYASWEKSDKRFGSAAGFAAYLKNEGLKYSDPVHITIDR